MNRVFLRFITALMSFALFGTPLPATADTSIASVYVSGVVPAYFSVTANSRPGELDLSSGAIVSNRTIGLLHFKYNSNIQNLIVSSSTTSGKPEDSGSNPYSFGGTGDFNVGFRAGCQTVDAIYNTPAPLTFAGTDMKSAASGALVLSGIEEDCELIASYTASPLSLPMAGRYELRIIIMMVSF